MKMSLHCKNDRMDRLIFILSEIGSIENVILEVPDGDLIECLTDTGVLLIKTADRKCLITAYLPTIDRVCALYRQLYGSKAYIPTTLEHKIQVNRKKAQKFNQKVLTRA